jgi:hypothetical protein
MPVDLVPFALVLVLSLCVPGRATRLLRFVERPLSRLGRSKSLAIVVCGLIAVAISASLSLFGHFPEPAVHDEFSYLLAADTFAHGRLSNPTHPLWSHFESMHILQQPTYASKYPPAQGLFLAAGQVFTGQPIVGAWLSGALAAAAICWMLLAWTRPRWAVLGGLVAAVHPLMLLWSQCYWGGAVAVCGGALLLGGIRRLAAAPRLRDSLLTACGIAILANSRPFEGLVLTLLAGMLFVKSVKSRPAPAALLTRAVLPLGVVLLLTAGLMGYYNWRITGRPFQLPYAVHEEIYAVAPPFLWQSTHSEPAYRHKELRDQHAGWELQLYEEQQTLWGFLSGAAAKISGLFQAFFAPLLLLVSLITFPLLRRDRWMRLVLVILGLFTLALLSETWMHAHYAAPIAGLVLLLSVQALRYLRTWRWQTRPVGRMLVRASLLLSLILVTRVGVQVASAKGPTWSLQRARILAELKQQGGRHLVLVHYGPEHSQHAEWVYNEADIDQARVVWAREMGPEQDRELLDYFKNRCVWQVDADAELPRMTPYRVQERGRESFSGRGPRTLIAPRGVQPRPEKESRPPLLLR